LGDPIYPPKKTGNFTSDDYRAMVKKWQRAMIAMQEELAETQRRERDE
jgi:hypothetical protein